MAWTDERVEILKKLWADGLSASQIAGHSVTLYCPYASWVRFRVCGCQPQVFIRVVFLMWRLSLVRLPPVAE